MKRVALWGRRFTAFCAISNFSDCFLVARARYNPSVPANVSTLRAPPWIRITFPISSRYFKSVRSVISEISGKDSFNLEKEICPSSLINATICSLRLIKNSTSYFYAQWAKRYSSASGHHNPPCACVILYKSLNLKSFSPRDLKSSIAVKGISIWV